MNTPLPPVDLRIAKPGDKLRSKHGLILTYEGVSANPGMAWPHLVRYPDGASGSRTHDGFVMLNSSKRLDSDHDIIEIIRS